MRDPDRRRRLLQDQDLIVDEPVFMSTMSVSPLTRSCRASAKVTSPKFLRTCKNLLARARVPYDPTQSRHRACVVGEDAGYISHV